MTDFPDLADGERVDSFIYAGRRLTGTKIAYHYRAIDNADLGFVTAKPIVPGVSVGTIVSRVVTADGKVWVSGPKAARPVGRHDGPELSEWDALDRAAAATKQRLTAASKTTTEFETALDRIALAYDQTPPSQRAGLLTHIITRLR